jgi:hypothetical protein
LVHEVAVVIEQLPVLQQWIAVHVSPPGQLAFVVHEVPVVTEQLPLQAFVAS